VIGDLFPKCELHGCRVVTSLPVGCPLGSRNPSRHLESYQDKSYPAPCDDPHVAAVHQSIFNICKTCVFSNSSQPHIRFLRRKAGLCDE
jgi:hypothetical protein